MWIAKFLCWGTNAWKGLPKQWPQHAQGALQELKSQNQKTFPENFCIIFSYSSPRVTSPLALCNRECLCITAHISDPLAGCDQVSRCGRSLNSVGCVHVSRQKRHKGQQSETVAQVSTSYWRMPQKTVSHEKVNTWNPESKFNFSFMVQTSPKPCIA